MIILYNNKNKVLTIKFVSNKQTFYVYNLQKNIVFSLI